LYNAFVRKVILGLGISLDGYIARPDGSVDFLFMPKDYSMAPFLATVDAGIMGRKTYDAALKMGGGFVWRIADRELCHVPIAPAR
jgi:dihydrofolate reductase